MRTDSAAILRSAFSGSIRLGTLEDFLAGLSADELDRLHYDFELWARDDQLPPKRAGGGAPWTVWLMLAAQRHDRAADPTGAGGDGGQGLRPRRHADRGEQRDLFRRRVVGAGAARAVGGRGAAFAGTASQCLRGGVHRGLWRWSERRARTDPPCAEAARRPLVRASRTGGAWGCSTRSAGDGRRTPLALSAGETVTGFGPSDLRHRLTLEQLSRRGR